MKRRWLTAVAAVVVGGLVGAVALVAVVKAREKPEPPPRPITGVKVEARTLKFIPPMHGSDELTMRRELGKTLRELYEAGFVVRPEKHVSKPTPSPTPLPESRVESFFATGARQALRKQTDPFDPGTGFTL